MKREESPKFFTYLAIVVEVRLWGLEIVHTIYKMAIKLTRPLTPLANDKQVNLLTASQERERERGKELELRELTTFNDDSNS